MPYVTRDNLRNYLGITGSEHDEVLDSLIEAASEACDMYTGRINGSLGAGFLTHSVLNEREWLNEQSSYNLDEWPVQSISSISLRGDALTENTDYILKDNTGQIFFIGSDDEYRTYETGPLKITYVAGFEAAPHRVKLACLRLGSYWFSRKSAEGVGAQLIGDMQETFRVPEVKRILDEELEGFQVDLIL